MKLYLDTSLVVALITREGRSAAAQNWLQEQAVGETAISEWVTVEGVLSRSIVRKNWRGQAKKPIRRLMSPAAATTCTAICSKDAGVSR